MLDEHAALPVEQAESPEQAAKWPKVIGVISLIYAIGGLLFFTCTPTAMAFLSEQLMAMGGMHVEVPFAVKAIAVVMGTINGVLGIMMLVGAIGVLRRKPSGVAWLKRWAILRIMLVVLNVVVTYVTAPMQMEFQRSIVEAQNDVFRERGMEDRVQEVTDERLWRKVMIPSAVMSGVLCIYPAFLGFFLSGRRVSDQVRGWV